MAHAIADQLNALLADVWSLVKLLRKLESKVELPGTKEALKRVRIDCSAHCAALSSLIRTFGIGPVDKPGGLAEQIEAMNDEGELWTLLITTMASIGTRVEMMLPSLEPVTRRDHLVVLARNVEENRKWVERMVPNR